MVALSLRYRDDARPSMLGEVFLYVDDRADSAERDAPHRIFLGRTAGGSVANVYGSTIGVVLGVRPARISLEHVAPRKRTTSLATSTAEAEGEAPEQGDVYWGTPSFDQGTALGTSSPHPVMPVCGPGIGRGGRDGGVFDAVRVVSSAGPAPSGEVSDEAPAGPAACTAGRFCGQAELQAVPLSTRACPRYLRPPCCRRSLGC